jgi:hypothetical protein
MWLSTETFASEFGATLTTQQRCLHPRVYLMRLSDGTVVAGPCESEKELDAACLRLLNVAHRTEKTPTSC